MQKQGRVRSTDHDSSSKGGRHGLCCFGRHRLGCLHIAFNSATRASSKHERLLRPQVPRVGYSFDECRESGLWLLGRGSLAASASLAAVSLGGETSPIADGRRRLLLLLPPVVGLEEGQHVFLMHILYLARTSRQRA